MSTLPSAADTREAPATSFVRHTTRALARLKPKYHKTEVSLRELRAKSFEPKAYRALARLKPKYHQEDRALAGDRGIAGQGDKAHGCAAAEKHHSLPWAAAEKHHSLPRAAMKRRSGIMAAQKHHSLPPGPLPKTRCCETASLTDTPPKAATNATLLHVFIITHCIL